MRSLSIGTAASTDLARAWIVRHPARSAFLVFRLASLRAGQPRRLSLLGCLSRGSLQVAIQANFESGPLFQD